MADTKISALTDGTALAATDRIPVARSPFAAGDNRYISGTELAAFVADNSGGLDNVVEDTTPELGGDIDFNGVRAFGDWAQEANTATAAILALGAVTINGSDPDAGNPYLQGIYGNSSGLPICTFSDGNDLDGNDMGFLTIQRGANGKCNFLINSTHTHGGFQFFPFAGGSVNFSWHVDNYPVFELSNTTTDGTLGSAGVQLEFNYFNPVSLTDNLCFPGFILFNAIDSASNPFQAANIECKVDNNTNGVEVGQIRIRPTVAGTENVKGLCIGAGVVVGDDGVGYPGTGNLRLSGTFVRTTATTVGSLVAAATAGAGARSFVTDATVTTFASIVAGTGSNGVPVYSDGTNWRIG